MDLSFDTYSSTKGSIYCLSPDFVPLTINNCDREVLRLVGNCAVEMLFIAFRIAKKSACPSKWRHEFASCRNSTNDTCIPAAFHSGVSLVVLVQKELTHILELHVARQLESNLSCRYTQRTHRVEHDVSAHVIVCAVVCPLGKITKWFIQLLVLLFVVDFWIGNTEESRCVPGMVIMTGFDQVNERCLTGEITHTSRF